MAEAAAIGALVGLIGGAWFIFFFEMSRRRSK